MPPMFTKPMEKTARFQPKFEWPGIADHSAPGSRESLKLIPGGDTELMPKWSRLSHTSVTELLRR
jgi:hypothetical protein